MFEMMNEEFFFISYADEEEIDRVVDSIQQRCAKIQRIEHIGLDSVNILELNSKERSILLASRFMSI